MISKRGRINYDNSLVFRIPCRQGKDYGLTSLWLLPRNISIADSRRVGHGQQAPSACLGRTRRLRRP
jgi:hypothetical protein